MLQPDTTLHTKAKRPNIPGVACARVASARRGMQTLAKTTVKINISDEAIFHGVSLIKVVVLK